MNVVVNTSPLIALDRINQLNVLPSLYGRIVRPRSVVDELMAGRAVYGGSQTLFDAEWITTAEDPAEMILRKELGAGETAVIALAVKTGANLVVLDDLAARNVANELGLRVTGTLGVLLAAHRKGYLPDLEKALNDLVNCGFRISENIIRSVLNRMD